MRLNQREQIYMLDIARLNPGPLADWLVQVVQAQQRSPGATFELISIPVPNTMRPVAAPIPPAATATYSSKDSRQAREKFLEDIGYKEFPLTQRRAIRKYMDSTITEIRESDLLPSDKTCWLGKHDPEEWQDETEDNFLWLAVGQWSSGVELKKWGCASCAEALSKSHPEAKFSANSE
jgi:hypothetical protein